MEKGKKRFFLFGFLAVELKAQLVEDPVSKVLKRRRGRAHARVNRVNRAGQHAGWTAFKDPVEHLRFLDVAWVLTKHVVYQTIQDFETSHHQLLLFFFLLTGSQSAPSPDKLVV